MMSTFMFLVYKPYSVHTIYLVSFITKKTKESTWQKQQEIAEV